MHGGGLGGGLGVLGEKVGTPDAYDPSQLFPVPRARGRTPLGLAVGGAALPFQGEDVWNCYELSWLQPSGVPRRKVLECRVDCTTPNLVESKSFKLYLNSLNFTAFASEAELLDTIGRDLQGVLGASAPPTLVLHPHDYQGSLSSGAGELASYACIDDEPVEGVEYPLEEVHVPVLTDGEVVTERLCCHQLRTLCPVTSQPDWGSVFIAYTGPKLQRGSLLRHIASLRREVGFHEAAVERIFQSLLTEARPTELMVTGQFLRRGGVDINPTRTLRDPTASS
ncbi:NADPH dependent preQ0 reductase [Pavlovales sp. CCMP2436]|nr:NADPH dependent preQ0 reductase [Pavlovales sp. CCMP2436]|mmetsp:Transcript_924/g.2419  ORF Transcript_924/g.2419 Transcript_924/m.2419 type:complete len:281 (-) Transcript_924:190-1032(-)